MSLPKASRASHVGAQAWCSEGPAVEASAAAGSFRLLFVGADSGPGPLPASLLAYPDVAAADFFDARSATPTLTQLLAYDVVVLWTNYAPYDSAALGDVLADYSDAGGKVILVAFDWYGFGYGFNGGRFNDAGYNPLVSLDYGNHYYAATLGAHDASHPLLEGVAALSDIYRDYTALGPGASLVASWSDGEPLLATKGCVVAVNSYPGPDHLFTGQFDRLYHNAVVFLMSGCAVLDQNFRDDAGRAQMCVSRKSGDFIWNILSGPYAGYSITGTALARNGGTLFYVSTPSYYAYCSYDPIRKRATGYFYDYTSRIYSTLSDSNTTDNPPGCAPLPPG